MVLVFIFAPAQVAFWRENSDSWGLARDHLTLVKTDEASTQKFLTL